MTTQSQTFICPQCQETQARLAQLEALNSHLQKLATEGFNPTYQIDASEWASVGIIKDQAAQLEHLEQVAASRQAEIDYQRALLRQWVKVGKTIKTNIEHQETPGLDKLITDTTEALK